MNNKDDQIFFKYTQGVEPINRKNRIKKGIKKIPIKTIKQIEKVKKIEIIKEKNTENIKNSQFLVETGKINKMLKKGQIPIDKKIDFHGKILSQAEVEFQKTVLESYKQKKRCLLFITGKGVLKKTTNDCSELKLYYGKIRSNFMIWMILF